MKIALLSGGSDKPYALGIVDTLLANGHTIEFVGSDELLCEELVGNERVHFLNFRGDTNPLAPRGQKISRIAKYYFRLFIYASRCQPMIFHILWANRFWFLDRVLLNVYYKLMGKKLVFTAHNVNERKRDGRDSLYNRLTLKALYKLVDHIFVHTKSMKMELIEGFGVDSCKVSVIPFGINNTLPNTCMQLTEARRRLALSEKAKVFLFFGRIAEYKGLEYAIQALPLLRARGHDVRLVVAGRIESGCEAYWQRIQAMIGRLDLEDEVVRNIDFIPDDEVEIYFKAADALLLPYRAIFQSGVLFLAYGFGLPVIAANVGSFEDDILEGQTGLIFRSEDIVDLADTCERYFDSQLFRDLPMARKEIKEFGNKKYSWDEVGKISCTVYERLLAGSDHESHICEKRSVI